MRARAIDAAPHRLTRPPRRRRPGAVLSRGPDLLRDPAGERRPAGPLLDPASERDAAPRRACAEPARRTMCRCECRRMGGGFGGKESQSALFACVAGIAAKALQRPVKLRVDRDDDFLITGRRHCFWYEYEVGYDDDGRLLGAELTMVSRAGHSADLSGPVMTRAICHFDNAYCAARRRDPRLLGQDQHAEQHRVPRLRRAAGRDRDRAHPRLDRARARPRPARRAARQLLRHDRAQRHAVRPGRRGQHHPRAGRRSSRPTATTARAARRSPRSTRPARCSSAASR